MGGLTQALRTARSGLLVNQQTLDVVANNIANVNTAGYVRKVVDQTSAVTQGRGAGVDAARV